MTKENTALGHEGGSLVQIGETIQNVIVGVLDSSSTVFRSIVGTFKDSFVFTIKSCKEISDEAGAAIVTSIKNTIEETKNISQEGTRTAFGLANEIGKNLKSSTIGTIEGTHEVSVKAANTFGSALTDLTQCAYDTGTKIGNIAKNASLSVIRGTAEIGEELFGKIRSGVNGVISLEKIRFGKKAVQPSPKITSNGTENN